MTVKLSKPTKKQIIESIKRYFAEQLDEEIGDLKASLLLDFCLQETCRRLYSAIRFSETY